MIREPYIKEDSVKGDVINLLLLRRVYRKPSSFKEEKHKEDIDE